jgi:hypothetical protein
MTVHAFANVANMQRPSRWYLNLGHITSQWAPEPAENHDWFDYYAGRSYPSTLLFLLFLCIDSHCTTPQKVSVLYVSYGVSCEGIAGNLYVERYVQT